MLYAEYSEYKERIEGCVSRNPSRRLRLFPRFGELAMKKQEKLLSG
jgi:hypothetical protein